MMQVMEDGQLSVLNISPAPNTLKHAEEELEEGTEGEKTGINVKQRGHCPRWAHIYFYCTVVSQDNALKHLLFITCLQIISC